MAATEPIRHAKQISALCAYFLSKGEVRNYLLVTLGIHTALRISDLLQLKWEDVYDFDRERLREEIRLVEQKTGKPKIVSVAEPVLEALGMMKPKRGHAIIENPRTGQPISRIQAYRVLRSACEQLELGRVSCHSLRKTFGYHAWKSGAPFTVIMDILNHTDPEVTRRYLGICQDDRNAIYQTLCFST
ncbi:MAG: tyrosine-type recombinase/integrase [Oscillospiraceae bacterium]|nr:tyrosine-type recombinase/integrase [Oscillospiraceae bacterium]